MLILLILVLRTLTLNINSIFHAPTEYKAATDKSVSDSNYILHIALPLSLLKSQIYFKTSISILLSLEDYFNVLAPLGTDQLSMVLLVNEPRV